MTTRNEPSLPKYYQLREELREQIATWEPDTAIPTGAELCKTYGVSFTTVRRALDDLLREGLLYTIQGKGTFVAPHRLRSSWADEALGFHADMTRRGLRTALRVLSLGIVPAAKEVAAELQLELDAEVIELVRLRQVSDQPFDICTNYLPAGRFPGLEDWDFSDVSLYDTLRKDFGVAIQHGIRLVSTEACQPEEANLLAIKPGSPLLVVISTMYDAQNQAVEYGISRQRGDRAQVRLEVRAQG